MTDDWTTCRCDTTEELYGAEAEQYVAHHLRAEAGAGDELVDRYSCPDTGRSWLLDYPDRTERELGQARLRVER